MSNSFDLLVIGGGPAGLAAAVVGREAGMSVALVDEQPDPGGQIYRAVERAEVEGRAAALGQDYRRGLELVRAFRSSGAVHFAAHQVWQLERDGRVFATDGASSRLLQGRRVLVAVGAMERPVPIPGWTLPGVMTTTSGLPAADRSRCTSPRRLPRRAAGSLGFLTPPGPRTAGPRSLTGAVRCKAGSTSGRAWDTLSNCA
jgi:glycine/D-amino acid oxidase-like deaminating enzyme